ncbi:MAG: hypothetical protein ABIS18_03415 [Actinomycetota bacterium]
MLIVTLLGSLLVVPGSGQASIQGCTDQSEPTFANFIRPDGGKIQVQSGPTGVLTITTAGVLPSVFISTTGQIEVEIQYGCLNAMNLEVYKEGNSTPIYTNNWTYACGAGTQLDSVNIGLDGGSYSFQLTGLTCSNKPLRGDGHGGYVADPPLL